MMVLYYVRSLAHHSAHMHINNELSIPDYSNGPLFKMNLLLIILLLLLLL